MQAWRKGALYDMCPRDEINDEGKYPVRLLFRRRGNDIQRLRGWGPWLHFEGRHMPQELHRGPSNEERV